MSRSGQIVVFALSTAVAREQGDVPLGVAVGLSVTSRRAGRAKRY